MSKRKIITGLTAVCLAAALLTQPVFAANNGRASGASGGPWLGVQVTGSASVPQGSKPDIVTSVNDARANSFLANEMTKDEKKSVFTGFIDRIKSGMAYAWDFVRDWVTGLFS